ncbi:MAG: hypothetical protein BGO68_01545 [Candidatus Amoebophilus sp. 36-38]|nr:MAG: hypothetical protein BGO68_01545 [Candidatus Amoebophilus sp. 36-38]
MPRIGCVLSFWVILLFPQYVNAAIESNEFSPIEKVFTFDLHGSPHSASSLFLSSRTLLNELEDYLIPEEQRETTWAQVLSSLINFCISERLSTINHEIFGHGFRGRSLDGVSVDKYKFSLFGKAATHYHYLWQQPIDVDLLITIAGTEANQVLAREIMFKHFKYRTIDIRTYFLFFAAFFDLTNYILTTSSSEEERDNPGNDIMSYIKELNKKYDSDQMNLDQLSNALLPVLLNPLWALMVYFLTDSPFTMPYVVWDDIAYMPLLRPGLSPFGITYYLDNFLGYYEKTFLVSVYSGRAPLSGVYGGLDFKTDGLWSYEAYALDIQTNLWYQPSLQLALSDEVEDKNSWGGLVGISNKYMLTPNFSLHMGLSYKTKGFLQGMIAQKGWIWEGGVSFRY